MSAPSVSMFVMNTVIYDRRVMREALTLRQRGFAVTVYGVSEGTELQRETHPNGMEIVRVPITLRIQGRGRRASERAGMGSRRFPASLFERGGKWALGGSRARRAARLIQQRRKWNAWTRNVLSVVKPSTVFHGHDLPGLRVAATARSSHGGRLVYDSHDLFLEAGANAHRSGVIRSVLRRMEARLYREIDLLVTVNHSLKEELHRQYGSVTTAVVHNCVPRRSTVESTQQLRSAAAIPPRAFVAVYHGGFTANRGLGLLAQVLIQPGMEEMHVVLVGYGPMEAELRRIQQDPRFGGRLHVLDAVSPDSLEEFISGANVAVMINQPASLNEVLSTPNKLFESLAAGLPVVTSDFPERRRIVMDDPAGPLGRTCDPTDVNSVAAAIREILNLSEDERGRLRSRCLEAARVRWCWEHEAEKLCSAYDVLVPIGLTNESGAALREVSTS